MSSHEIRFAVSLGLGIGPALLFLWLSLRRFDYPNAPKALFDDRKVFFAFAVGMVFGVFASLLALAVTGSAGLGVVLPLFAVALFEESFKLAYVNRPGYRGRFDTTFYGASLGIGSSATLVIASAFSLNPQIGSRPDVLAYLAAFAFSMAGILSVTGSLIGFGAAQKQVLRYFVRAYLVRLSHLLILIFFFVGEDAVLSAASLAASIGFALGMYAYVYREVLPETLPTDLRKELRRWPGKAKGPVRGSG